MRFGVDGAPQVNHAPIDFQIDLVQMPDRMRFGTALAQFRRYDRPEMINPASDCFVRNCNSALREQIFDVTKAEREPEIEPDRLVNDLRREPISGLADFRLALWLPSRRRRDNVVCKIFAPQFRLCSFGCLESIAWSKSALNPRRAATQATRAVRA